MTKSRYICAHCGKKIRGYGWSVDAPFKVGEPGFMVVRLCDRVYDPLQVVCRSHFLKPLIPLEYCTVLRGDAARQRAALIFPDGSEEHSEEMLDECDWGMGDGTD